MTARKRPASRPASGGIRKRNPAKGGTTPKTRPAEAIREARDAIRNLHEGSAEILAEVSELIEEGKRAAAFAEKVGTFLGACGEMLKTRRPPPRVG